MGKLLKQLRSVCDIRSMSYAQLDELANEIRCEIIGTVSKTGGHLAPNLGVVELTLALHTVFNSPLDKIIWDVGHQCYIHKLITDRKDEFNTLRQFGGVSGFPRSIESIHDPFGTGHSSTSISAALGMAIARDIKNEKFEVVAVVGDGAMTGGMAYEAMNCTGHLKKDLIVVLNDNEMSIDENVGAMSGYLTRLRTDPMYSKGKEEIEQLLRKVPIGSALLRLAERVKDSLKYLVVPGMLFEELGFIYLGPVDGHDIRAITNVLKLAKSTKGPVLVHVLTKKGKGYLPAEKNPDMFHGVGAFNALTGEVYKNDNVPSYTEIFGSTIIKLAEKQEKIVCITAAMSSGTGLTKYSKRFPQRFFDVGIAEQHAVTMAAGMAAGGYHPVVAVYSTFLQRAYDQILHDVCLQNLPVTFAIDRSGIVGEDGSTHHGLFDIAYLRHIPNMVIMSPKDENEFQHMLATAVNYGGPASVRYPRGPGNGVIMENDIKILPIGRSEIIKDGNDLALLAIGSMVVQAEEVAELLSRQGLDAAVINARFVKPLDERVILEYARKTGKIITLEEHVLQGGFGSAVLELLSSKGLYYINAHRFGIPDTFVEHGNRSILKARYGLTSEQLAKSIINIAVSRRSSRKLRLTSEQTS